jgi:phosphatidylglycerophosphate synthase
MSVRQQSLKTSNLGKLKTVVQMGGIGVFFLTVFVPGQAMPTTIFWLGVVFALLAGGWWWRRRQLPLWLAAAPVLLFAIFAMALVRPREDVGTFVFVLMVLFTWVSGADYLSGSVRAFRQTGGVKLPDVARVLWSFAHGLALVPLLASEQALAVPVIVSLSAELSLGGVENLVAAERGRFARGSVLPTMLAAVGVGACAWFDLVTPATLVIAAWGLAGFSLVNLAVAFWLDRDVFLAQPA